MEHVYHATDRNGHEIRTVSLTTHIATVLGVITILLSIITGIVGFGWGRTAATSELVHELKQELRLMEGRIEKDVDALAGRVLQLEREKAKANGAVLSAWR